MIYTHTYIKQMSSHAHVFVRFSRDDLQLIDFNCACTNKRYKRFKVMHRYSSICKYDIHLCQPMFKTIYTHRFLHKLMCMIFAKILR